MQAEIKNEWIYEQSPNEVWEYLTQSELIALWLMPNNFEPILGHEFQFTAKPIPSLDLDGIFPCKVLEIVPHQKLVYSWKGGSGNGNISLDTIVEWTLEKLDKGTKLSLKQYGFKDANISIFHAMSGGWSQNVVKMRNILNEKTNGSTNV